MNSIFTMAMLAICMGGYAQNIHSAAPEKNVHPTSHSRLHHLGEEEYKNILSINVGESFIAKGAGIDNLNAKGHLVPSIGLDYFRKINTRWEIGVMLDWELGTYIIPHKENLEREHALIAVATTTYSFAPTWCAFVGAGIELEQHENLPVLRLGLEKQFHLNNGWFIPVGSFMDIKDGYDAWSLSVGIGREF